MDNVKKLTGLLSEARISLIVAVAAFVLADFVYAETRKETALGMIEQQPIIVVEAIPVRAIEDGEIFRTELHVRNEGAPVRETSTTVATFLTLECFQDTRARTLELPVYGFYDLTLVTGEVVGTTAAHRGERNTLRLAEIRRDCEADTSEERVAFLDVYNIVEANYTNRAGEDKVEYLRVPHQGVGTQVHLNAGRSSISEWLTPSSRTLVFPEVDGQELRERCFSEIL